MSEAEPSGDERPEAERRHRDVGPQRSGGEREARDRTPRSNARRALLERLIDHAALFPPASLDMPAALEEDRRARASDEAWMLDRFIVPASRLAELPDDPPALSVVLDRGEGDMDALAGYPVELVEGRIDVAWIPDTTALVREKVGAEPYWELPPGRGLTGAVAAVREAGAGAKIRCGGVTADAFPTVAEVASFVAACRDAGVRFKATAGLHHPVRGVRDGLPMHGFLNLLAAAVFAHAHGLSESGIADILAEEDPAEFAVDDDGIAVHGHRAGAAEIAAARADLFTAYGSCSFFEPVDDLTALGILPA